MPPVANTPTSAATRPIVVSALSIAALASASSLISFFAIALSIGLDHCSSASTCGKSSPRSSHS